MCVNSVGPAITWEFITMHNRYDFFSFNSNFDNINLIKTGVSFNSISAKLCSGNASFISSSLTILEAQQFDLSRITCNGEMLVLNITNTISKFIRISA